MVMLRSVVSVFCLVLVIGCEDSEAAVDCDGSAA